MIFGLGLWEKLFTWRKDAEVGKWKLELRCWKAENNRKRRSGALKKGYRVEWEGSPYDILLFIKFLTQLKFRIIQKICSVTTSEMHCKLIWNWWSVSALARYHKSEIWSALVQHFVYTTVETDHNNAQYRKLGVIQLAQEQQKSGLERRISHFSRTVWRRIGSLLAGKCVRERRGWMAADTRGRVQPVIVSLDRETQPVISAIQVCWLLVSGTSIYLTKDWRGLRK